MLKEYQVSWKGIVFGSREQKVAFRGELQEPLSIQTSSKAAPTQGHST